MGFWPSDDLHLDVAEGGLLLNPRFVRCMVELQGGFCNDCSHMSS